MTTTDQLRHPASAEIATVRIRDGQPERVLVSVASEVLGSGLVAMLARIPGIGAVHEHSDLAATGLLASGGISVLLTSPPVDGGFYAELSDAAGRGKAKILVLLRDYDHPDSDIIEQALELPADGYILESGLTRASLPETLRQLHHGQSPMPAMLARALMSNLRASQSKPGERPYLLTARELQVLSLMVDGFSNKQIASQLRMSEHGAKRHVACVLAKLNCPNRTAAVALVMRQGLLNRQQPGRR